jgi:hypothetical protein
MQCHKPFVGHTPRPRPPKLHLLTSFTEAADMSMFCAWNQHGTLFAFMSRYQSCEYTLLSMECRLADAGRAIATPPLKSAYSFHI